jgi:signal transduction histidine kinase
MTAVETLPRATIARAYGRAGAVMGNPAQLRHCLVNLILNASQAFESTEPHRNVIALRVFSVLEGAREMAVLEVEDNGRGMSSAQAARIFDPFFTTRAPGQGMGLGLATCDQVARELGGRITVESRLGHGTTFRLVLPTLDGA